MEVNNKLFAFFWDHFNFPIRLVYCRSAFISKILFWKLYASDFEVLDKSFENMMTVLNEHGVSMENKTALELGPGNSFILAYNFLARGARRVILVDKFPRIVETKKQKEYYHREIDYIKKKYNTVPFITGEHTINPQYLEYLPHELTEVVNEKVDFIYSNSVLEHITLIEENISAMAKILREGGYMYHNIDLRDHYNFNNPFLFYKYEDSVWNRYLTREGVSYTNRMRCDDYIALVEKYGFKKIYGKTEKRKMKQRKISSRFKDKDNDMLEITNLNVLLKKSK